MTSTAVAPLTLPRLVHRYLERATPGGAHSCAPDPVAVRIRQHGQVWTRPGAQPLRFTAVQEIAVHDTAFAWRARLPLAPLLPLPRLTVLDELRDGAGRLVVRAAGLVPVQRAEGAAVTAGEVVRYLAELPLAPHAMRCNRALVWREIDSRRVEVTALAGDRPVSIDMAFDELGDMVAVTCPDRPLLLPGGGFAPTPWGGSFTDYAVLGGVRVPTRALVWWELPEGRFTTVSATVTGLELVF